MASGYSVLVTTYDDGKNTTTFTGNFTSIAAINQALADLSSDLYAYVLTEILPESESRLIMLVPGLNHDAKIVGNVTPAAPQNGFAVHDF